MRKGGIRRRRAQVWICTSAVWSRYSHFPMPPDPSTSPGFSSSRSAEENSALSYTGAPSAATAAAPTVTVYECAGAAGAAAPPSDTQPAPNLRGRLWRPPSRAGSASNPLVDILLCLKRTQDFLREGCTRDGWAAVLGLPARPPPSRMWGSGQEARCLLVRVAPRRRGGRDRALTSNALR